MSRRGTKFLGRRNLIAGTGFDNVAEKAHTALKKRPEPFSGADWTEEGLVLRRFNQTIA
jgi:hypothetical protein